MPCHEPLLNLGPEITAGNLIDWLRKTLLLPPKHGDTPDLLGQAQFADDLQLGEEGSVHDYCSGDASPASFFGTQMAHNPHFGHLVCLWVFDICSAHGIHCMPPSGRGV
jgi:hypothetical protein